MVLYCKDCEVPLLRIEGKQVAFNGALEVGGSKAPTRMVCWYCDEEHLLDFHVLMAMARPAREISAHRQRRDPGLRS